MTESEKATVRPLRCAIYTRKSTEEGLELAFNTLHAQREAAEAYIASQRQNGWVAVAEHFDDGGFSGATLKHHAVKFIKSRHRGAKFSVSDAIGAKSAYHPGRASALRDVGALSDLDNVTVRIADVAANLAVLFLRLGDELGSSTFP